MSKVYLHSSITNESITRMVEDDITELADRNLVTLGEGTSTKAPKADVLVSTKVWGFTRDRSKIILEIKINDVSVNRVIVNRRGGSYVINTNPRFIADYKRKVGIVS